MQRGRSEVESVRCGAQGAVQAEVRGVLHDSQSAPRPAPHNAREWPVLEEMTWGPHLHPLPSQQTTPRPSGGGAEK